MTRPHPDFVKVIETENAVVAIDSALLSDPVRTANALDALNKQIQEKIRDISYEYHRRFPPFVIDNGEIGDQDGRTRGQVYYVQQYGAYEGYYVPEGYPIVDRVRAVSDKDFETCIEKLCDFIKKTDGI
jgi:hypothetical protein